MGNDRVHRLYLVSRKTCNNECVFESENVAECFDKLDELRTRKDFTRKYYKNDFAIMEEYK